MNNKAKKFKLVRIPNQPGDLNTRYACFSVSNGAISKYGIAVNGQGRIEEVMYPKNVEVAQDLNDLDFIIREYFPEDSEHKIKDFFGFPSQNQTQSK